MKSNHFNKLSKMNEARELPLAGIHVLLCEDCIDQGRLLLHYLKKAGAEVTLECNGLAAVETMEENQNQIHVVIMDFRMPQMDGLEATRRLREMGYEGGIIAVTSYDSQTLREEWMEAGCDAYLTKPLSQQKIIDLATKLATASPCAK